MTEPRQQIHFDRQSIGHTVLIYDSLPSTNDLAAQLALQGHSHGTIVVADHQTAGRGQYGRTWQSRAGQSLLMSVILFPEPNLKRPVLLTAWAAVAVAQAVELLCQLQCQMKWPNDLLLEGRKLCGILIEQNQATIVGIGLNLNQTAAELAELPPATSLASATGRSVEPSDALAAVSKCLDDRYAELGRGLHQKLEHDWQRRLNLSGKLVAAERFDGRTVAGVLKKISFDQLAIDTGSTLAEFTPETVRQLKLMADGAAPVG